MFSDVPFAVAVVVFLNSLMLGQYGKASSKGCRDKCVTSCFKSLDHVSTYSQLKIKESFHIKQLKPELNKEVEHVSLVSF